MKNKIILSIVVFSIMAAAIAYVVFNFDFSKLLDLRWDTLVAGCLFLAASILLYALATQILLRGLGFRRRFLDILAVNLVSQVAKVSISSKIDIPIKVYLNKKFLDLSYPVGMLIITLRIFLELFITAVLAAALLLFIPGARLIFPPIIPISLIAFLGLVYGIILKTDLNKFAGRGPRLFRKVLIFAAKTHQALKQLPQKNVILAGVVLGANLFVTGLFIYYTYIQLGCYPGLDKVFLAYAVSILAGFFSMVPLGIGVMEASFILLMARFQYPSEISTTVILVKRVIWTFFPIVFSLPVVIRKGASWLPTRRDSKERR
jgi:uncharacterized membrane protein YbhN (UPF0104 family)